MFHDFGANGIALDESQEHLYVGNTDYGRILRIGIRGGKAAEVEVLAESDSLKGADGNALDKRGTLYVAVNAQDRIATVDRHGDISVYAEGAPFDAPSSVVFGRGCGDERTLYLSSFALYRANGFIPGTPHPAIQSIQCPLRASIWTGAKSGRRSTSSRGGVCLVVVTWGRRQSRCG